MTIYKNIIIQIMEYNLTQTRNLNHTHNKKPNHKIVV